MIPAPVTIAIHTFGQDARADLIADVRAGLTATPKTLPPRWLYDERGSELFEAITQLPEYYLTRIEAEILRRVARNTFRNWDSRLKRQIFAGFRCAADGAPA